MTNHQLDQRILNERSERIAELERLWAEAQEDFDFLDRHRITVEDPDKDPDHSLVFRRSPGARTFREAIRSARKERA